MTVVRRHALRLASVLAMLALMVVVGPLAALAADDAVNIRRIDTSAWPAVTVNVMYTGATPDLRSFVLREGGAIVPTQTIDINPLDKTKTPVGVVLAIDTSGSMDGEKLVRAKDAAKQFVERKRPEDQIAVVAFSDAPRVVSGLNPDGAAATAAINALGAGGETALWDGVIKSVELLANQPALLPYVVLLSDGADSVSGGNLSGAAAAAQSAGASVFAVGLGGGGEFDATGLRSLADATSGRYDEAASPKDLDRLYASIQGVLQNQYELTWTSDDASASDVEISVTIGTARAAASAAVNSVTKAPKAVEVVARPFTPPIIGGSLGVPLLAVLVGLSVLAAGMGIILIVRPGEKKLEEIVADYTAEGTKKEPSDESRGGVPQLEVSAAVGRMIDAVAQRAGGTDVMERLDKRLDKADIKVQSHEAVLLGTLGIVVSFGFGLAMAGPLVGLAAAICGGLLPIGAVNFRAERRQRSFVNQLPDTLQLLSSSLRAGFSLLQGLDAVSQEVEAPMGRELRRVVLETRLGRPLDEALQDTADRMSSPDFEWVVLAIGIQREVGGNLAELLTTVADTMLSREQLRREVQALTAEGKLSAIIIGLLPIGLAVAISVLNPGYLSILFTTSVGKALVLVAVLLATAGFFWMRKTIQVEV